MDVAVISLGMATAWRGKAILKERGVKSSLLCSLDLLAIAREGRSYIHGARVQRVSW